MPIVTYDTSIFIAYKPAALPAGFRMSAVVIQELTAGAVDKSEVQRWQVAMRAHEKEGTLLVPTVRTGGSPVRFSTHCCAASSRRRAA
jgi:hypothetical protein